MLDQIKQRRRWILFPLEFSAWPSLNRNILMKYYVSCFQKKNPAFDSGISSQRKCIHITFNGS